MRRLSELVPAVVGTARERLPPILAAGSPVKLLRKANFAELLDVPPKKTSVPSVKGLIAPALTFCQ